MQWPPTGPERQEIPFRFRRREHLVRVEPQAVEDDRQLVHQRDVEVALRVLDHFRRLRNLDARSAMDARRNDPAVERRYALQGLRRVARDHLHDARERVLAVARIDALGRIADVEILLPFQPRGVLQRRHADAGGRPGVDGGFIDHRGAALQVRTHGARSRNQQCQVGALGLVHRRGHGHDHEISLFQRRRISGYTQIPGRAQFCGADFAAAVLAARERVHALLRAVVADGAQLLAEPDRERQPYVAQAHDRHDRVRSHAARPA